MSAEVGAPLHIAAADNAVDIMKILIENGAEIDICDDYNDTPLHLATYHKSLDAMQLLLDSGANVNALSSDGYYPLSKAITPWMGNIEPEVILLLLKYGADINAVSGTDALPALHTAAELGEADIVKLLIEHGADINLEYDGLTPLDAAMEEEQEEVIEILRSLGAVNSLDEDHTDTSTDHSDSDTEYE